MTAERGLPMARFLLNFYRCRYNHYEIGPDRTNDLDPFGVSKTAQLTTVPIRSSDSVENFSASSS